MSLSLIVSSVACLGAVAVAVGTQLGFGWEPCVLCVEIRALLLLAGALLGVAAFIGERRTRRLFVLAGAFAGLWSAKLSAELFALEKGWVDSFSCTPFANFPSWMPLHEWFPVIFQPQAICGDAAKSFLLIPLSAWPIIIIAAICIGLFKYRKLI